MSSEVILVVDDTPANLRLMEAVLGVHDYAVTRATSGEEALAMTAGANPPDLVLLDVRMPGLDGFEVCRRIRATPSSATLPVIMVTASGNEEKVAALEAGADDFVTRPFDQSELLARVRSLLRIKHYQDTIVEQAADLAAWNRVLEEQVAEQVDEVQRLQRLRRFLVPQVADSLMSDADESLLEPHRGEVAVVCVDVRGFSTFASSAEPEEVVTTLHDFHQLVGDIVNRSGATVGSFTAAGLMMIFNDPLPCPQPSLRAVVAAAELRDAARSFATRSRELGWDLSIGVGVGHGYATLGVIGFEGRREYTAIGSLINSVTTLAENALAGEVLLTSRVVAEVESHVDASEISRAGLNDDPRATVWLMHSAADAAPPSPAAAPAKAAAPWRRQSRVAFRVLGPVEMSVDDEIVSLPGLKLRRLLGLLVLQRRQIVSVDRLADALWGEAPPTGTTATLRVYMSRLRKVLAGAGEDAMLVTHPSSYQLNVPDELVDVARYEALVAEGRAAIAAGHVADGAAELEQALRMWRGPAYAELSSGNSVSAEALRLEESRQELAEEHIDAQLAIGNHRQVLGELHALAATYPLRERLCGQLMTALYRCGRPADALAAYQAYRERLADELGLDPSSELEQLHLAMLNRAAELDIR